MARGHFITFEGGEGAGKTTQILGLAEMLRNRGETVLTTREPGGSVGAEAIRSLLMDPTRSWSPLSEALLHNAARCEHVNDVIRPALERGEWVICDRFTDSTRAYQGYGMGLESATLTALENLIVSETRPELTLVLDVPVRVGLARARSRGEANDRYEDMDFVFHERLREGYRQIAADNPERCRLIDATQPAKAVQEAIRGAVERHFAANP